MAAVHAFTLVLAYADAAAVRAAAGGVAVVGGVIHADSGPGAWNAGDSPAEGPRVLGLALAVVVHVHASGRRVASIAIGGSIASAHRFVHGDTGVRSDFTETTPVAVAGRLAAELVRSAVAVGAAFPNSWPRKRPAPDESESQPHPTRGAEMNQYANSYVKRPFRRYL